MFLLNEFQLIGELSLLQYLTRYDIHIFIRSSGSCYSIYTFYLDL